MKFNWGTGIALTLILFAVLMGFMVSRALQQDFDLVSDNYYQEELAYQDIIDRKTNALKLEGHARLVAQGSEIYLTLPADLSGKNKTMTVHMYCEQEADNDFHLTFEETTENKFSIPFKKFGTGKWIAKVKLTCEGTDYYFDPSIVF